jgi:hypothetical protein
MSYFSFSFIKCSRTVIYVYLFYEKKILPLRIFEPPIKNYCVEGLKFLKLLHLLSLHLRLLSVSNLAVYEVPMVDETAYAFGLATE